MPRPVHDSERKGPAAGPGGAGGTFALARGPLGWVLAAVGGGGEVRAVFLGDSRADLLTALRRRFPGESWAEALPAGAVGRALAWVGRAIASPTEARVGGPRLAPAGTPFQRRVWSALCALAVGECVSYGELARRVGCPRAVRAVAQACGANPIAVLIPCHRVIAASGALTGYRWGVERKRALLAREGVVPGRGAAARSRTGGDVAT